MSCVMCESYCVQLRPAVDVLVVPYSVRLGRFKCFNVNFRLFKDYIYAFVCVLIK